MPASFELGFIGFLIVHGALYEHAGGMVKLHDVFEKPENAL
jgi:hypothetical protein